MAGVLVLVPAAFSVPNTWTAARSMNTARLQHTATLLPGGKVLVAGGFGTDNNATASAELFDPTNGTWSATGLLNTARGQPTATLLPNGKVLVAGGVTGGVPGTALASAELYDPTNGTWTTTGPMHDARSFQTATLLLNGQVLVAGGFQGGGVLASAELYDPTTRTWTTTASMSTARGAHTATLLRGGQVLVAGGQTANGQLASAELYVPTSGAWSATGSMNTARGQQTATLLPDGQVLVAGGLGPDGFANASAELFSPPTDSTSTSVNCSPGTVAVGAVSTCTATVTDTAAGTPTTPSGTVSFGSAGVGSFADPEHPNPCTLDETSSGVAACSVSYTPGASGTPTRSDTVTATYGGDVTHATSSGTAAVTVRPTSRADCQHGGWQNYGFQNQRDCIQFVNGGLGAPPPISKADCLHGGWQNHGFTSQGDCVAFVATGGKNEPGKNVPTPKEP